MSKERKFPFEVDDKKYVAAGLFIILLTGLFVGVWGFLTKVDTFVIAPGKVVIETFKKPVQYKEWGTVSRVFVREGEFVKAGQPLIELERLEQRTNYKVYFSDYYNLLAKRDRLISEKKGLSRVVFSKEFLSLKDGNLKRRLAKLQEDVFRKRRQKLRQELAVLESKKEEVEERIRGLENVLRVKKELLKNYDKEIEEQKSLVNKGLVSKYRLIDLEREKKRTESDIDDIEAQIVQLKYQIEELDKQKELKLKTYKSEVVQELEKVLAELYQVKPKLDYSKQKIKKSIIVAPVSGQVIGLKVYSKGEVVRPGDTLMYIVPQKDRIFVLAKVSPKDRDKVHVGQKVDLRFPSFLSIAAKAVEGRVTYVSDDTLEENVGGRTYEYYETHIVLTEKGKKLLKENGFSLIPGMPAVAYIRAEKITPIEYLLQPLIILMKSAFRAN